jgi:membrane protein CcdC involved in cytochrome C biogenesis
MTGQQQGTLLTVAVVTVLVGLGVARRIRPEPVRPTRLLIFGAFVVVVIGLSLVGTGAHLIQSPLAVALALVCLAVGVLLGVVLVRTMRFWTDPNTGELWMAGGALFAIILVGTVVLRFGVRYAATGDPFSSTNGRTGPSAQQGLTGFLYVLSSDLLLLTLGLWVSRAVLLYLRYREHLAQRPGAHPSQPAG